MTLQVFGPGPLPPTISGTVAGQTTTSILVNHRTVLKGHDRGSKPGQTETVTVTLSGAANGTLANLGGGSYDATQASIPTPAPPPGDHGAGRPGVHADHKSGPGRAGPDRHHHLYHRRHGHRGSSALPDSTTTVIATDVGAPTLTAPLSATVNQGAAALITGVSLAEIANVAGETFTVTLADTNGLLSATGTGVSGSGTTSLTISGWRGEQRSGDTV